MMHRGRLATGLVLAVVAGTVLAAPWTSAAGLPATQFPGTQFSGTQFSATPSSAGAIAADSVTGAAGHDYATDVFGDPWDYSNSEDMLLDAGPTGTAVNASIGGGLMTLAFTGD